MNILFYVNLATGIGLILFVAIAVLLNSKSKISMKGLRRVLYPASGWIYQWIFEKREERLHAELAKLYPSGFAREQYKKKYMDKIACSLIILFVANGITLGLGWMEAGKTSITDAYYIERNTYGHGTKRLDLSACFNGERHPIVVEVQERKYKDEELGIVMSTCNAYIEKHVLGENEDLGGIRYDLNFFDRIEDYSVEIVWKCSDYSIIGMDGTVKNTDLTKACDVVVTAVCSYFEHTWEYAMDVCVCPAKLSEKEQIEKQIYDALSAQDEITKNDIYLELPRTIYGENIIWESQNDSSIGMVGILGVIAVVLLFAKDTEDMRHRLKNRDQLLIMEYPVFVHKFVLLLGAGMTAQAAWMRMVSDYEKQRHQGDSMKYVYEEMIITANEMKQGITQTAALENFGHRCGLSGYLKFCSILIQSLKTGAKGMGRMLKDAADEAALMRKENAKRLGETAGTKLMIPMIILFAIVMVILIVPAFIGMNI